MTVITMPSSEKKADNVPLVTNMETDPSAKAKDLEAGNVENDHQQIRSKFLVLRVINDRVYSMWALVYVLLMSLLITIMMLYGEHIYKAIGNAFSDENDAFYGTGTISLSDQSSLALEDSELGDIPQFSDIDLKNDDEFVLNVAKLTFPEFKENVKAEDFIAQFKQQFELDLKHDNYEKIDPILPQANSARFIHDFSTNTTGIVDIDGMRCFIMPLNRSSVLPPKSMYDLLFKMTSGYYTVDTSNILHNMRVVTPAVEDITQYGIYIAKDCAGFPTYKLEKIVSGVFKRSVPANKKVFYAFSGNMESFRVVNYHDIDSA